MKHHRGINLLPAEEQARRSTATIGSLEECYTIVACCRGCEHNAHVDRWEIARKYGNAVSIIELARRLKCSACGNATGNTILIGKLPRD